MFTPKSPSDSPSASGGRRPTRRWLIAAPAALTLVLAGCSTTAGSGDASSTAAQSQTETTSQVTAYGDATDSAEAVLAANQEPHDEDDDADWSAQDAVTISLDGGSAEASDSSAVAVDGSTVTITAAGTYVLSGDLEGQVVVNSTGDGQVKLVLDGVEIANADGAAIDIQAAEEAVVILADGSENTLSDAGSYADDATANAALYSAADLTITGTGALEVMGNGNDGIAAADGLVIQSGSLSVTSADDGIRGKDYVVIRGGDLSIEAGGDGVKADNAEEAERGWVWVADGTTSITAGDDGIAAATDVVTTGGSLEITAGGGTAGDSATGAKGITAAVIAVLEGGSIGIDSADDAVNTDAFIHLAGATLTVASGDDGVHAEQQLVLSAGDVTVTEAYEGLESAFVTISGGDSDLTASDDAINVSGASAPSLTVTGGTVVAQGEGDGVDVNGQWTQTGGTIVVVGPNRGGDGAIDADGTIDISGGVLISAGGSPGTPDPAAAQASVQFAFTTAPAAGTVLTVVDASGTALASFTLPVSTGGFVYSSAEVVNGQTYSLVSGGTAGTTVAGPYAEPGTAGTTVVATAVAGEQTSTMGGGPGGGPGDGGQGDGGQGDGGQGGGGAPGGGPGGQQP